MRNVQPLVVATLMLAAGQAGADAVADYAVFGNHRVSFEGFTKTLGAPVVSNGDLFHFGGVGQFTELRGAGTFDGAPGAVSSARQNVAGNVTFNGDVRLNALSNVAGSVSAGGKLDSGAVIAGNATAASTVDLRADVLGNVAAGADATVEMAKTVHGDLSATGNVTLSAFAKVLGNVTHGGTLSLASQASVGSSKKGTIRPQPEAFTPVPMSPATPFTSGGADRTLAVFEQTSLAPGSYGTLTFAGSNKLSLAAGNYYFDRITSTGSFITLNLDLSTGPIYIYVTGPVDFRSLDVTVNGQKFSAADPALASRVFLETHADFSMNGNFFGTVFAPAGDVATRPLSNVVGSLIAGDEVVIGSSTDITYVRSSNNAIPEPAFPLLAGVAVAVSSLHRKRVRRCRS